MNSYLNIPSRDSVDRTNSPLRVKDLQSKSALRLGSNFRNEEDEYERRRQEEVRKHLAPKESESSVP